MIFRPTIKTTIKNLISGVAGYPEYTVLNGKTNDVSDPYWSKTNADTDDIDEFQATAPSGRIEKALPTIEGMLYTLSFFARVESGGNKSNYLFKHYASETGDTSLMPDLTETRELYTLTVLGRVGGGNVYFGLQDTNSSNWAKLSIDTINITDTPCKFPSIINNTSGPVTIPQS